MIVSRWERGVVSSSEVKTSLQRKLIEGTVKILLAVSILTLSAVAFLQLQSSQSHLDAINGHITQGLTAKGQILAANHALALRGLVEDNAYGEVKNLVKRGVVEDSDVIYGLFLDADYSPWAFTAPGESGEDLSGWKKLGVTEDDIEKEATTDNREYRIFDSDVLEFSAKVQVEGDTLGTVRYGLSTKAMELAQQKANEESQANLVTMLSVLVGLAIAVLLGGSVVTWKQAVRITMPLAELTRAADTIATGDHTVQADVHSGDEIELLANSFNKMVRDLAASYEELEDLNKGLEQKVAERTSDLKQKSDDVENMLKNLRQGIFTVTISQTIHHEYSAYLEKILDTEDIAGRSIMDVLLEGTTLGSDMIDRVFVALSNMLGKPSINFVMNSHLLPTEFEKIMEAGTKILETEWNAISDDSGMTRQIMVTLRDVTELRQLQAEMGAQKRQLEIVGEILAVPIDDFQNFLSSTGAFLERNEHLIKTTEVRDQEVIGELFRNMHTIKGNARTYGFSFLVDEIHDSETVYKILREEADRGWDSASLLESLGTVVVAVQEYAQVFESKLSGLADLQPVGDTIDPEFVTDMFSMGDGLRDGKIEIADFLVQFEKRLKSVVGKSLQDVLSTTISGVQALAEELEKPVPLITISQPALRVPEDMAALLQNVFVHVFRNSVDHGLESADERRAAGKEIEGQITLEAEQATDKFIFHVYDDGRGLNLARLKEKAEQNGGSAGSDQELAELIFASGMSTAQEVTDISGRGVGMDAIRKFLEERGGSADIQLTGEVADGYRSFKLVFAVPL